MDEMLHMTLAANMLNAVSSNFMIRGPSSKPRKRLCFIQIEGNVNLTTFSNLPFYPTSVGIGEGFKLMPNLVLSLGKMSRGVVSDIFMPVEQPADDEQRKVWTIVAY